LLAGSENIMRAITEKMRELARKKEEDQLQQQARDSDTLSTIAVTPFNADPAQLNRSDLVSISCCVYRAGSWHRHCRQMPRAYDVERAYNRWLQNILHLRQPIHPQCLCIVSRKSKF